MRRGKAHYQIASGPLNDLRVYTGLGVHRTLGQALAAHKHPARGDVVIVDHDAVSRCGVVFGLTKPTIVHRFEET